jgi:hypothetical protein
MARSLEKGGLAITIFLQNEPCLQGFRKKVQG